MKRMLINATQIEEVRVALVDGQSLYDVDIESLQHANKKANIYKGTITRIEPSLEAAFVDYGVERHGFLPLKEIAREYYPAGAAPGEHSQARSSLKVGQELIVQIDKEERGLKGAALTTYISLAGSYLVLMPNNPHAGGISRRIEGEDRVELKTALKDVTIPEGMSTIVRTAGVGKTSEELQGDLDILVRVWEMIRQAAAAQKAPFLIHQESNIALRAIRDYLRPDIGEILVDSQDTFEQIRHYLELVRPEFTSKVHLYTGEIPLFSKFQIESQIDTAYQREVRLPSGGAIVIDPTEALTSIDVNSAKATHGGDIEETALQTNIEAAVEIARQLRLRDVGGLIVIDFIDMKPLKNQREIETRMREAVRQDRARVQFSRISRFGLLEMSRQRLSQSLEESSSHVCPMCNGQGTCRDTSSLALSILRLVEEEAHKENIGNVTATASVEVATFLLNEKRAHLAEIEKRNNIGITIVPNKFFMPHEYKVERQQAGSDPRGSLDTLRELSRTAQKEAEAAGLSAQNGKGQNQPEEPAPAINTESYAAALKPVARKTARKRPEEPPKAEAPSLISSLRSLFSSLLGGGRAQPAAEEEKTAAARKPRTQRRPAARPQGRTERAESPAPRRPRKTAAAAAAAAEEETEAREPRRRTRAADKAEKPEKSEAPARRTRTRRSADESAEAPAKPRRTRSGTGETPARRTRKPRAAAAKALPGAEQPAAPAAEYTPYQRREAEYTSADAAEGPGVTVDFSAAVPARPYADGARFEHSGRTGGLSGSRLSGIDRSSEPEALEVDYSRTPEARPHELGADFEKASGPGGLSAPAETAASGIADASVYDAPPEAQESAPAARTRRTAPETSGQPAASGAEAPASGAQDGSRA